MSWSYRIARISGIDVKIHVTFLLLLGWFGWIYWHQGGLPAAAEGIFFILLLFLCVLLHEFGHAFAARMYGIRTPDITLLPIGGVARLERMPANPVQELVVAVAGPAVNVVIAAVLFAFLALKFNMAAFTGLDQADEGMLQKLAAVNVMLIVFNAIPAFPMDGGRVLRALLAMRFDYVKATTVAARVGQVMAVLFFIAGFTWSPMLAFIAIFVFSGAQQELNYAKLRAQVVQRAVSDFMRIQFAALQAEMPCREAAAMVAGSQQPVFPIVDRTLRTVGVITRGELLARSSEAAPVAHFAMRARTVPPNLPMRAFLAQSTAGEIALVETPAGQLLGLIENPGTI